MRPLFTNRTKYVFIVCILITSCSAFNHGYTWNKALNSYALVTGEKHNFGDKRLKYNKGFHNHSQLSWFLNNHSKPDFIYEYKTPTNCRGIKLFYPRVDSVYVFEEPHKGNLRSVLKDGMKMEPYDHETYARLKKNPH